MRRQPTVIYRSGWGASQDNVLLTVRCCRGWSVGVGILATTIRHSPYVLTRRHHSSPGRVGINATISS